MQKEMFDSGLSAKAPVPTWNQSVLKQIVAELHGETTLGPSEINRTLPPAAP